MSELDTGFLLLMIGLISLRIVKLKSDIVNNRVTAPDEIEYAAAVCLCMVGFALMLFHALI